MTMHINGQLRTKVVTLLAQGELTVAEAVRVLNHRVSRASIENWVREERIKPRVARRKRVSKIWQETRV